MLSLGTILGKALRKTMLAPFATRQVLVWATAPGVSAARRRALAHPINARENGDIGQNAPSSLVNYLMPVVAIPSTIRRWKSRKKTKIGTSARVAMANIGPQVDALVESRKRRSPSETV